MRLCWPILLVLLIIMGCYSPQNSPTAIDSSPPRITGRIAFLSANQLYVVNFECTASLDECDSQTTHLADGVDELRAPSWSPDGKQIVFVPNRFSQPPGNIYAIEADGSDQVELLIKENTIHQPTWSSVDNMIAFFDADTGVEIISVGEDQSVTLLETDAFISSLAWSFDGKYLAFEHLIVRGGWLKMYVLEVDKDKISDQPIDNIFLSLDWGRRPSWSPDGKQIVYVCDDIDKGQNICALNLETQEHTNLTANSATDDQPMWSPDGEHIIFVSDRDGNRDIHIMNTDGSEQRNLTNTAADELQPNWSPDGKYITFMTNRDDAYTDCRISPSYIGSVSYYIDSGCNYEIYIMKADGTGQRRLTNSDSCDIYPVWAPS